MPSIFEKRLEDLAIEDIEELLGSADRAGCPENETVEFNGPLPENRDPGWPDNREITDYTKKRVLKEVVALANTAGGHFFLGVTETKEKPPIAESIKPIPKCADLADRLKRSADGQIDPPIPGLKVAGVKTDGDAGVVVFRVPQSRSAPHRLKLGMECYVRRGEESAPISMREIQDLTIHLSRRMDEIKRRFDRAHDDFLKWLYPDLDHPNGAIGLRVTAVPVGASLHIDRVYPDVAKKVLNARNFHSAFAERTVHLSPLVAHPGELEPVFRGARKRIAYDDSRVIAFSAYRDGVIDMLGKLSKLANNEPADAFALAWILNHVANVVKAARTFAEAAGAPECEYGVILELQHQRGAFGHTTFEIKDLVKDYRADSMKVSPPLIVEEPMSFGSRDGDRDILMNRVLADIYDACHVRIDEPPTIAINWDD